MTTTEFLTPVLAAAELLKLRAYPADVERLTAVLDKLSHGYPQDVMEPLEALRAITSGTGTVEELELLEKVWPDYNGSVRYKLTATSLTRQWSSKHSGVYTTITVPFPTILPMQVEVVRFCDMDSLDNHADECPVRMEESDDCNCESYVEQTVAATVIDWNDKTEGQLEDWLSRAVIGDVEPIWLGEAKDKTTPKPRRARKKGAK